MTGRPRRVGWLDLPMLRHATRTSGFTGLAVNHVDTLAGLDEVKVARAYRLDGEEVRAIPATVERWAECEPIYRTFEGWPEIDRDHVVAAGYDELPGNAQSYLEYVSSDLGTPIYVVGVGPGREQSVVLERPF